MRKAYFLFPFIFLISTGFPQGMFTKKGNFSLDAGAGYVYSDVNGNNFGSLAYNVSSSLFGVIDIGGIYMRQSSGHNFKRIEGGTAYLDLYAKKDSLYGIVINTAYSTFNYESAFMFGASLYGSFDISKNSFRIYPHLSLGLVSTEDMAVGFGISFEKLFGDKFSLVLTPAVNGAFGLRSSENRSKENAAQVILNLESIIKL